MAEGNGNGGNGGSRDKQFTWLYRGAICVLLIISNRYLDTLTDTIKGQGTAITEQGKVIADIASKVGTHDAQITQILADTGELKGTMATGKAARDGQIGALQADTLDLKIRMTKAEDRIAALADLVSSVRDSFLKLWAQINGKGHFGSPPP